MYTIRAFLEASPRPRSVVRGRKEGSSRRDACVPGQKRLEKMGLGHRQSLWLGWGEIAGRGDLSGVGEANCGRTEMPDTESAVLNDQLTVKVKGARRPKMT